MQRKWIVGGFAVLAASVLLLGTPDSAWARRCCGRGGGFGGGGFGGWGHGRCCSNRGSYGGCNTGGCGSNFGCGTSACGTSACGSSGCGASGCGMNSGCASAPAGAPITNPGTAPQPYPAGTQPNTTQYNGVAPQPYTAGYQPQVDANGNVINNNPPAPPNNAGSYPITNTTTAPAPGNNAAINAQGNTNNPAVNANVGTNATTPAPPKPVK